MTKIKLFAEVFLVMILFSVVSIAAQDEEPPLTRSIVSTDFTSKREVSGSMRLSIDSAERKKFKRRKINSVITNPKRRYNLTGRISAKRKKAASANKNSKPSDELKKSLSTFAELGVTFWKLRPLDSVENEDEDVAHFPVRVGNKTEKWAAARVSSKTIFEKGDRVRFTVEPSLTGYIYIVNRELYADGTTGQANMIFPTLRSRGGDNRVQAGSLIEIPAGDSAVPYFNIKPDREDYVGEELVILILPDQLPGFEIGLRAKPFSNETLDQWFADWNNTTDVYDAEDGEGLAYSTTESSAANVATRTLAQDEPLPQTIYKVMMKKGDPLLVALKLKVDD